MSVEFARLRSFYALIILYYYFSIVGVSCITLICKKHIARGIFYSAIHWFITIKNIVFLFFSLSLLWKKCEHFESHGNMVCNRNFYYIYVEYILYSLFFHAHAIYKFSDFICYVIALHIPNWWRLLDTYYITLLFLIWILGINLFNMLLKSKCSFLFS